MRGVKRSEQRWRGVGREERGKERGGEGVEWKGDVWRRFREDRKDGWREGVEMRREVEREERGKEEKRELRGEGWREEGWRG